MYRGLPAADDEGDPENPCWYIDIKNPWIMEGIDAESHDDGAAQNGE